MKVKIITLGKLKEPFIRQGVQHYLERFAKCSAEVVELSVQAKTPEAERQKASEIAQQKIGPQDYRIILDARGKQLASTDFASLLNRQMNRGYSTFSFLIGGPYGWSEDFLKSAHFVLSLSSMTLPSQLAVLVMAEQAYRALEILRGSPYHHE